MILPISSGATLAFKIMVPDRCRFLSDRPLVDNLAD
jgi:hypothetical protein